jgi:hypothetical protein
MCQIYQLPLKMTTHSVVGTISVLRKKVLDSSITDTIGVTVEMKYIAVVAVRCVLADSSILSVVR